MAILKSIKIHASPAVPPVDKAYLMIQGVEFSRVRNALRLHLICYASQDERDRMHKAVLDAEAARPTLEAGDISGTIPYPDKATDAQIVAVDQQRLKAAQDFMAASAKMEAAARVGKAIVPLAPLDIDMSPSVPAGEVAALLVNGTPDMAACYAWLASKPAYQGDEV